MDMETTAVSITKTQAQEINFRLQVAEESQSNEWAEDRLPVWGAINNQTLIVWSIENAIDEIENIIDRLRDPANHWNKMQTIAQIKSFQQLKTKLERNQ
jgi:hypothetical protein